ncbi:MAG: thymidine phosphorylase family protein [Betaproteobacteria bacterium]
MHVPTAAQDARASHSDQQQLDLQLKRVAIDTNLENVVYLNRDCPIYRIAGFQALSKVEVISGEHRITATLNVVDDAAIIGPEQIGLSEDAFKRFGVEAGTLARVRHAEKPASTSALFRKINGERLEKSDYHAIVRDISGGHYSKIELTAFLIATSNGELDRDEVYFLTDAMVASGRRLQWHEHMVVDKHCIGGIPGNRTSMLVVPIVAAHGLLCPKTSSRAITSPAGTADTMEVLANVNLAQDRIASIVQEHRACLAWGGTADLSPADDVMISVERPLSLDSTTQMIASILSKKIAAGSTHLILDIPIGPSAKVKTMPDAQRLRKLFEYVASRMHLKLEVVITDGRQPIGQGIGPMLEARDVMRVLENDPRAPQDLRHKSLYLAGRMIEFDPDVRGGDGYAIARDILESGRALQRMHAIIEAQGAKSFKHDDFMLGKLSHEVVAERDGMVVGIDNLQIAKIARLAGAPKVPNAGVDVMHKLGDRVQRGDTLYTIYAEFPSDLLFAMQQCEKASGYTIGDETEIPHSYLEF